jgi:DNA-binding response OmpR family regulator/anti-sigma regulatory factor (Ser/Thr protein kinase)
MNYSSQQQEMHHTQPCRGTVLLLGFNEERGCFLEECLKNEYYKVFNEPDAAALTTAIRIVQPHLIILDLTGDCSGEFYTIQHIKELESASFIPLLCLTEKDDPLFRMMACQEGADDVLCATLPDSTFIGRVDRMVHMSSLDELLNLNRSIFSVSTAPLPMMSSERTLYEESIFDYFRKTIEILSENKLSLLKSREEMDDLCDEKPSIEREIEEKEDIRTFKNSLASFSQNNPIESGIWKKIEVTVSEALANVLKYAGRGKISVYKNGTTLFVRVDDYGKGLKYRELLRSLFIRDFNRQRIHRLGYPLMMELCDTLFLFTSGTGTSLLLKFALQDRGI